AQVAERDPLGSNPLFRREATEAHAEGLQDSGDVLRLSPAWAAWSYRLILAVVVAALAFSVLGSLREYARGPAVVRMPGNRDVTAVASGTVTAVEAESGRRVAAGDVLIRLHGARELAELRRLEREMEQQLLARLRSPSDAASERALIALRAQWELAQVRLEETVVRAPQEAVVGSVRVRRGQHVAPGQTLVSLAAAAAEPSVVALLPGQYLPQVVPGMPLRLELRGYPQSHRSLTVDRVSDGAVGPAEARRMIGEDVADALALSGPVVLVEARLGSDTFEIGGESFRYHDGMYAVAEVPVRSDRILLALFPRLRQWWEAIGG
ncbi:MAG: HlyD family efflux transporter periplasmic adaptor subunit, partial [Acidobacteriota bacterium]